MESIEYIFLISVSDIVCPRAVLHDKVVLVCHLVEDWMNCYLNRPRVCRSHALPLLQSRGHPRPLLTPQSVNPVQI